MAVTKELVEYIEGARKASISDEQVRIALISSGWAIMDIDAALKGAQPEEPPSPPRSDPAATTPPVAEMPKESTIPQKKAAAEPEAEERDLRAEVGLPPNTTPPSSVMSRTFTPSQTPRPLFGGGPPSFGQAQVQEEAVFGRHHFLHSIAMAILGGIIVVLVSLGAFSYLPTAASLTSILGTLFKTPQALFALAPVAGITFLLVLMCFIWGRRIYRKENAPYRGFLFGTGLYLLLAYASIVADSIATAYITSISPFNESFAAVLLLSIPLTVVVTFVYIGFIVNELLLILTIMGEVRPVSALHRSMSAHVFRSVVIAFALVGSLYILGAMRPLATAMRMPQLCYFIFQNETKIDCFRAVSGVIPPDALAPQNRTMSTTSSADIATTTGLMEGRDLPYQDR